MSRDHRLNPELEGIYSWVRMCKITRSGVFTWSLEVKSGVLRVKISVADGGGWRRIGMGGSGIKPYFGATFQ
jgi:hypothetical protein